MFGKLSYALGTDETHSEMQINELKQIIMIIRLDLDEIL